MQQGFLEKVSEEKEFVLPELAHRVRRDISAGLRWARTRSTVLWACFFLAVYVVLALKLLAFEYGNQHIIFSIYSIAVGAYILSRFFLAYFYDPAHAPFDLTYEPGITFGVPCKNEEGRIRETILRIAQSDYPKEKFGIIAVNDGSTDGTLREMKAAKDIAKKEYGVSVTVVDWKENKGKRAGMAECARRSDQEILVFIDSDSFVEPDLARQFVKYFNDPKVAAVAGHADVANADAGTLALMQKVRYFVAFKAYKGAEALFGAVTCCSGCCAAYRRSAALEVMDAFENEWFLGRKCTYGDDRSLTNLLLRKGYNAIYAPDAKAHTYVPETFFAFARQQLRWKKSWVRETLKACSFMWKRNPIASVSFYLGFILPFLAPIVLARAVIWYPYTTGNFPWFYIIGITIIAFILGIYHDIYTRERMWGYGLLSVIFYTFFLIWQLPYAIATIRDPRWGTR